MRVKPSHKNVIDTILYMINNSTVSRVVSIPKEVAGSTSKVYARKNLSKVLIID